MLHNLPRIYLYEMQGKAPSADWWAHVFPVTFVEEPAAFRRHFPRNASLDVERASTLRTLEGGRPGLCRCQHAYSWGFGEETSLK